MLRTLFFLFSGLLVINTLSAQTDIGPSRRATVQQMSPADADLYKETNEVESFARNLAALKTAFAEKNTSRITAYEAYILRGMRDETDQMTAKANAEAAQKERRKLAGAGQIISATTPAETPARDPFAEATTPTEIRLESMTYTMAAFERHAFDPGQPEAAARDFAKLDAFLKIMQEDLDELKKARQ
jgi:hypothetical protein